MRREEVLSGFCSLTLSSCGQRKRLVEDNDFRLYKRQRYEDLARLTSTTPEGKRMVIGNIHSCSTFFPV